MRSFGGRLPEPAELLATEPAALRETGLSGRKVETLQAVAAQFADGTLRDEDLRAMSDEEIETRLTAIPGIGPWTVHGMLIIALDRPDVVLPGDLALRKVMQRAYGLDHLPTQDEVRTIAAPWRPVPQPGHRVPVRAGVRPQPASPRPEGRGPDGPDRAPAV